VPPTESRSRSDPTPAVSLRGVLSTEELRRWNQPNTARAIFDLALIWVQILGAIALYVWLPHPLTFVVAFVLVAGGQHALYLGAHEFAHCLVFPRNRALNDFVGKWFFAAPALLPFAVFRHRHFAHHRLYSTDRDTKTSYRCDWRGSGLLRQVAKSLVGWEFLDAVREVLVREQTDAVDGSPGPSTREALPPILIVQFVLLAAFALVDPFLFLWLWILPMVTLAYLFSKIRTSMEHQPLDSEGGVDPEGLYFKGTPGPFVRTVKASWLERLCVCKINFCFHAEHHLWPTVSYQYLPRVHERLIERDSYSDPRFGLDDTYASTIAKLWRPRAQSARP
jgi:fatty acid desaturase